MTRENKLALVVGFGLILFVGILISDHFSVVRTQHAADLTKPIDDPLLVNVQSSLIDLIEDKTPPPQEPELESVSQGSATAIIQGGVPTATPGTDVIPLGATAMTPESSQAQNLAGSESVPGFVPYQEAPATRVEEYVFHEVKGGETLYAICRQHYGSTANVNAVANYNNMDDPASLRVGQRLRIPKPSDSAGMSSRSASADTSAPVRVTYTVKDGDSLSEIAQKFLGSKGKWRKLYDMNRDVLDDPDNVKVGMVLRVS